MNFEPIRYFFQHYPFDKTLVKQIVFGKKYIAVLLTNGNIGVCACLDSFKMECNFNYENINPDDYCGRVVLNAYYNALFNYENKHFVNKDIYEVVDFTKFNNIVMIGWFKSLVRKFKEGNIQSTIFDIDNENEDTTPMNLQNEYLQKADCVVITATSVANNTFCSLMQNVSANFDVYLLGPSALMHEKLFEYPQLKGLFGTLFFNNDMRIIEIINQGDGTRTFAKFAEKKYFSRN